MVLYFTKILLKSDFVAVFIYLHYIHAYYEAWYHGNSVANYQKQTWCNDRLGLSWDTSCVGGGKLKFISKETWLELTIINRLWQCQQQAVLALFYYNLSKLFFQLFYNICTMGSGMESWNYEILEMFVSISCCSWLISK